MMLYWVFKEVILQGYKGNTIYRHFGDSMVRLLSAFALAVLSAIPVGLLSGYSSKIKAVFEPIVNFFQTTSTTSLLCTFDNVVGHRKFIKNYAALFSCISTYIHIMCIRS